MTTEPESRAPSAAPALSDATARYALGLLVVVYVFNFIDRQILSILLEDIKDELELSDTYLGFLTGFAFAFFYTFAGIPLARWADWGNRRSIIALAVAIWSAFTAATGLARSFAHLALARVAVGIGEAGCSPPAHSLISDYFPVSRRGRALGIYSIGIPIGGGLGLILGGQLKELFDWRTAFIVVGLPGVALAVLVRLTLREPPRAPQASEERDSIGGVLRFMIGLRSFRHMSLAAALHAFVGYGAAAFNPSFLRRIHELGAGEVGLLLGAIALTFGVLGTFSGGALGDWLSGRDRRWYMWAPALATLLSIPFNALFYVWPDPYVAVLLSVPGALLGPMYLGPTFAMTQTLARPRMRAVAAAVLLFIINLIGLGLGPQCVGLLSEYLRPTYELESLRYALLYVVALGSLWSAAHYYLAARSLREDLERE